MPATREKNRAPLSLACPSSTIAVPDTFPFESFSHQILLISDSFDLCCCSPVRLPPQFHPNIYPDGTLCMDLIQDNWSPIYSVCSILIAIRSLLTDPNCASPANPEAAHLYQTDKKAYSRRVRRVAEKSVSG